MRPARGDGGLGRCFGLCHSILTQMHVSPYIAPIPRIASATAARTAPAAGLLIGPFYALGFLIPPPVQPDAVQFLPVHPAVPAGRAGWLFLARAAQQSGPGDL